MAIAVLILVFLSESFKLRVELPILGLIQMATSLLEWRIVRPTQSGSKILTGFHFVRSQTIFWLAVNERPRYLGSVQRTLCSIVEAFQTANITEPLKTQLLASFDTITIHGLTTVRIRVPAQKDISFVDNRAFYRESSNTIEVNGQQLAAVAKLFTDMPDAHCQRLQLRTEKKHWRGHPCLAEGIQRGVALPGTSGAVTVGTGNPAGGDVCHPWQGRDARRRALDRQHGSREHESH